MKRQIAITVFAALSIAVVTALVYLTSSSSLESLPGEVSGQMLASSSIQAHGVRDGVELRTMDGGPASVMRNGGEKHPDQTEHVVPENYSSNDPQQPWENEIFALADRLDLSDTAKAEQLLGRINNLPPEGKVLAMEYATKLIPDEDYLRLRPWIFNLVSSDDLRQTVLLDALTRGETLRMPTLVEMLRQPANPAQAEIREILVAYLDTDYGTDTKQWETAVQRFLAENPDL